MNDEGSGALRVQQLASPSGSAGSFDGILRAPSAAGTLDATPLDGQGYSQPAPPQEIVIIDPRIKRRALLVRIGFSTLAVLVVLATLFIAFRRAHRTASVQAGNFSNVHLPLGQVTKTLPITLASSPTLSINGQLLVSNSIVINPSTEPALPTAGQMYYDKKSNTMAFYNGTQFVGMGGTVLQTTTNVTNVIGAGGGTALTAVGGTAGVVPKFTAAQVLGASIITDDGATVTVGGDLNIVNASAPVQDPLQIWPDNPTPGTTDSGDPQAVEIGVKIKTDVSGFITALRFYKGVTNTGTHVAHLWSASGTALATVTFTSETASGWQQIELPTPIAIAGDTTYIASYHTTVGHYAFDAGYFASGGHSNGVLHAQQDGEDGGNGVFKYSATPAFPNQSASAPNYWVDVVFKPNPPPPHYQVNGVQIASSDLSNNADLAKRSASQLFTGNNAFRSNVASTSAFSIQNVSGTSLLTADTVNSQLFVGTPGGDPLGIILVLGRRNTSGDPVGAEGGMYYNATQTMFRCYRNGTWGPCANLEIESAFSLEDEFMGGQTNSFSTNNIIGSLGWTAQAIGANGSIDFNPASPTPLADRPGVLALTTPAVANQGTTLMLGNSTGGSMIIQKGETVKTAIALTSTTNQVVRIGIHNETGTTTSPISGVWWEANPAASTQWRYCFGNGTAATCTATSHALAANTWTRLEIRVITTGTGATTIDYAIDGDFTTVSNVTVDSTGRVSPAYSCYTTAASAQTCYWDYYQLFGTTNSYR